ncbi:MAG: chitobiase/beta-hexosaminidase C-terminal domain-containing protein [Clostridia bacterium]
MLKKIVSLITALSMLCGIIPIVTVMADEEVTSNKYQVIEDMFVVDNTVWGINTTNANNIFVAAGPDENRAPVTDNKGDPLRGEADPSTLGKSRVGFFQFPVAEVGNNQRAFARFYVRQWHSNTFSNGNSSIRFAVYAVNDDSWTTLSDGGYYDSANAPLLESYSDPLFSYAATKEDEYITFDVTEIMRAAQKENLSTITLRLNAAWGAAFIVEREACTGGTTYEGKEACILVSDNVMINGSFEDEDGNFSLEGWNSASTGETLGSPFSTDHFYAVNSTSVILNNVETSYSTTIPDGKWALGTHYNHGANGLCSIKRYVPVKSGRTYLITYKVKSGVGSNGEYIKTSLVADTDSGESNTTAAGSIGTQWKEVTRIFEATDDTDNVLFWFRWLGGGSNSGDGPYYIFDDFGIYEITAETASTIETPSVIESLGGEVLWACPEGSFNDTAIGTAFPGWSSSVTSGYVNVKTYDVGNTIQYYTNGSTENVTTITSPGYGGDGEDAIIIEWKMKRQNPSDLYFDFSFTDKNGEEIAFLKFDKNYTSVTDEYYMGYPKEGTDCAIVATNNGDGTHNVEYYVAGSVVSALANKEGEISGFGGITSSGGRYSNAWQHIGFANLRIGMVNDAEILSVEVIDEDGNIVKDGYSINWYEKDSYDLIATGKTFVVPNDEKEYEYVVILDKDTSFLYYQPVRAAAEEANTVVLEKLDTVTVYGKVTNEADEAISDAEILFEQTSNGYIRETSVTTGADGRFSCEILKASATVRYSATGYYSSKRLIKSEAIESNDVNLGTEVMELLPDNKILLSLYEKRVESDIKTSIAASANINFEIYNATQNCSVTDFEVQHQYIYLTDEKVNAYDTLTITATDDFGKNKAESVTITLTDTKSGSVEITFIQRGKFKAETVTGNDENIVMIFDQAGKFVSSHTVKDKYTSDSLNDGIYTLVFMKKTNLLRSVATIEKLNEIGLTEGEDYNVYTVDITHDNVSVIELVEVPEIDEEKLYYTSEAQVSSSYSKLAVGRLTQIKATYTIDEKHSAYGQKVSVDLPEGVVLVEGSIATDGKRSAYTYENNTVIVSTNKRSSVVRFYVFATEGGDYAVEAYLSCTADGNDILQPLGSASFTATASEIVMKEYTSSKHVPISGVVTPNSTVVIYDNNEPVGETTANSVGSWRFLLELNDTEELGYHEVYATVSNNYGGIPIKTETNVLIYVNDYAEPVNMEMIYRRNVLKYNFSDFEDNIPYYSYVPGSSSFTFKVEFEGNNSLVKEAGVVTTGKDGEKTYVSLAFDEETGLWVGTHNYRNYNDTPSACYVTWKTNEKWWEKYVEQEASDADEADLFGEKGLIKSFMDFFTHKEDYDKEVLKYEECTNETKRYYVEAANAVRAYYNNCCCVCAQANIKEEIDQALIAVECSGHPEQILNKYKNKQSPTCDKTCTCKHGCHSSTPEKKTKSSLDPAGYVCEAVPSNRLEGVTATAYWLTEIYDEYGEPTGETELTKWDAGSYDQANPLVTNVNGEYSWFVPEGSWLVKYSKEGYFDTDSTLNSAADEDGFLPVPPPQTEVNVAMVSMLAPEVKNINAYNDGIRIEFTQYMDTDSVNTDNITVKIDGAEVLGSIEPVNNETSFDDEGIEYASIFNFVPDSNIKGSVTVDIRNVINYAGKKIEKIYSGVHNIVVKPESIEAIENISIKYNSTVSLEAFILPVGAKGTINVTSSSPSVAEAVESTVTTDGNGKAVIVIKGKLPGTAEILLELEGTDISATVNAVVENVISGVDRCGRVAADIESGNAVEKRSVVTLSTTTEGANIYYTLDKSDPSDEGNAKRIKYTDPITITEDTFIIAYATKDGFEDSAMTSFIYTIDRKVAIVKIEDFADSENTVVVAAFSKDGELLEYAVIGQSDKEFGEVRLEAEKEINLIKIMEWSSFEQMIPTRESTVIEN